MAETTDPPISTVVRALGDMASFHELESQPEPWLAPIKRGEAGLDLAPAVAAAYDVPLHTAETKAGARRWPSLVPTDPDMDGASVGTRTLEALGEWENPAFVLYSDHDPITHGARESLRELIPSADAQPAIWIEGAGHFLQEEAGQIVAEAIVAFVNRM